MHTRDIILPPIRLDIPMGISERRASSQLISEISKERDVLLQENEKLRRMLLAVMMKTQRVAISDADLTEFNPSNTVICSEYDARNSTTSVWLEVKSR